MSALFALSLHTANQFIASKLVAIKYWFWFWLIFGWAVYVGHTVLNVKNGRLWIALSHTLAYIYNWTSSSSQIMGMIFFWTVKNNEKKILRFFCVRRKHNKLKTLRLNVSNRLELAYSLFGCVINIQKLCFLDNNLQMNYQTLWQQYTRMD